MRPNPERKTILRGEPHATRVSRRASRGKPRNGALGFSAMESELTAMTPSDRQRPIANDCHRAGNLAPRMSEVRRLQPGALAEGSRSDQFAGTTGATPDASGTPAP
jgi:hypothetical protein